MAIIRGCGHGFSQNGDSNAPGGHASAMAGRAFVQASGRLATPIAPAYDGVLLVRFGRGSVVSDCHPDRDAFIARATPQVFTAPDRRAARAKKGPGPSGGWP